MLDFGFQELGLETIVAVIWPGNRASITLAEKLGLRFWKAFTWQGGKQVAYRLCRDKGIPGELRSHDRIHVSKWSPTSTSRHKPSCGPRGAIAGGHAGVDEGTGSCRQAFATRQYQGWRELTPNGACRAPCGKAGVCLNSDPSRRKTSRA